MVNNKDKVVRQLKRLKKISEYYFYDDKEKADEYRKVISKLKNKVKEGDDSVWKKGNSGYSI